MKATSGILPSACRKNKNIRGSSLPNFFFLKEHCCEMLPSTGWKSVLPCWNPTHCPADTYKSFQNISTFSSWTEELKFLRSISEDKTHFCDHSRFMPDFSEKAVSISCCGAVRVGTGLEDGVGAGATNARRISSVVAIRMKSWSFTMHRLKTENRD